MPSDEQEAQKTTEKGLIDGKEVSRREFLKYAGVAGAAVGLSGGLGGLLAACGGTTTTTAASAETTTTAGTGSTTVTTAGSTTTVSSGPTPPTKDKITIGAARPITGNLSNFEAANFGPAYKLWTKETNAAGGITVAGKPMQIEMKVYDDQSTLDTSMRLLTKLIEEDKVDFVFAPASTAFLFAAAGVCNAKKYLLMSSEGGATTLEAEMNKGTLPYFFQVLNYSDHYQIPVMTDLMTEFGMKSASLVYMDDLHGIEYQAQAQIFFSGAGIKVMSNTAIPMDIKDVSSVVSKVKSDAADLLCLFIYPVPYGGLVADKLLQIDYSPKAILWGPGGSSQWFYDKYAGALDGVMFEGSWGPTINAKAKDFYDRMVAFVGRPNVDFWGALEYQAQLEAFQQAIEQAASLDNTAIAAILRDGHFKTTMTDDFFFDKNQILNRACYSGQIGQWIKGIPEVVDKDKRTATPIFPKPAWKDAPANVPADVLAAMAAK